MVAQFHLGFYKPGANTSNHRKAINSAHTLIKTDIVTCLRSHGNVGTCHKGAGIDSAIIACVKCIHTLIQPVN